MYQSLYRKGLLNDMKRDHGRYLMLIALVICFVFLIAFTKNESSITKDSEDEENEIEINNQSLFIQLSTDGILYINGSGKINSNDLNNLLTKEGIPTAEISHIIIGDDISEIGYNAINGLFYLETIKLGEKVRIINNGAIRNCNSLNYVYLPQNIEKIGKDFLCNCNNSNLCIITDGEKGDLPGIDNIEMDHWFFSIHSYEECIEALNQRHFSIVSFDADKLATTDPNSGINPIILHSGYVQYGPYTVMEKGTYIIKISGGDLDNVNKDGIYYTKSSTVGVPDNIQIDKECILYDAVFEENTTNVEFVINYINEKELTIQIDKIEICKSVPQHSETIGKWWSK